jgi:urease accessory protein
MPGAVTAITTTTTAMMKSITTTEPALLRLLAWLSPAFPTGGFAYSHGIEWAVEAGDITDEATLRDWLADVLVHGAGRSDAILLRHAHGAAFDADALAEIAELAEAAAPCRERRKETLDQGNAFMLAVAAWAQRPLSASGGGEGRGEVGEPQAPSLKARVPTSARPFPPPAGRRGSETPYPIAVGAMAGQHGIDPHAATCAFLQAFAANLISAAVRLVPLGQSAGLRVLASLEPVLLDVAAEVAQSSLDAIGGCAFRSDIAAMRHETQYTRLFRS